MTIYRTIYEDHYGPIPFGHHIHHIDGNHSNNHIDNLQCVSAQEHYDIHKEQGDYGACWAMIRTGHLTVSPEERSFISSKTQLDRIENKTHHFLDSLSQSDRAKRSSEKQMKEGTHYFLSEENSIRMSKIQCERIENDTWALKDYMFNSETARLNNISMLKEGKHPSQQKRECPVCHKVLSLGMFVRWKHGIGCKG